MTHLVLTLLLMVIAIAYSYAQEVNGVGVSTSVGGHYWLSGTVHVPNISGTYLSGDGSQLTNINSTYPQNVSISNLTVSDTSYLKRISATDVITMNSSTLPTCNANTLGQTRRSGVKSCYCDSSTWKNLAPPSAFLSLLGINILVADTCP